MFLRPLNFKTSIFIRNIYKSNGYCTMEKYCTMEILSYGPPPTLLSNLHPILLPSPKRLKTLSEMTICAQAKVFKKQNLFLYTIAWPLFVISRIFLWLFGGRATVSYVDSHLVVPTMDGVLVRGIYTHASLYTGSIIIIFLISNIKIK